MGISLGLAVLVLGLGWYRAHRHRRLRPVVAFLLAAPCWAYHVALLFNASQLQPRLVGFTGVVLGCVTAFRLSANDWSRVSSGQPRATRFVGVLAAWSVAGVLLFAYARFGT